MEIYSFIDGKCFEQHNDKDDQPLRLVKSAKKEGRDLYVTYYIAEKPETIKEPSEISYKVYTRTGELMMKMHHQVRVLDPAYRYTLSIDANEASILEFTVHYEVQRSRVSFGE